MNTALDALIGIAHIAAHELWQDREVRFDASTKELKCREGEAIIEVLEPVEDTKGNNGVAGELCITNLRLVWVSKKSTSCNISIGFGCFATIDVRAASSRLKGDTESLYILTKHLKNKFEFVFTSLGAKGTQHMFDGIKRVFAAYDETRLFRDLKLRGALLTDGELNMMPLEQTYSKVNGVWNLCSDEGNLGSFFVSNVRVVWYSHLSTGFNVSFPYLQMTQVRIRNSKFGPALVLESTASSGKFVLGFKVDPQETLDYVFKEITSLWQAYKQQPFMGMDCDVMHNASNSALTSVQLQSQEEDVEVLNPGDQGDALAAYYADGFQGNSREPVYCGHLGLAVEQLKDGTSVESLWSVL